VRNLRAAGTSGKKPADNLQDAALIPLVLLADAGLSLYIPARRGARIDPIVALRE